MAVKRARKKAAKRAPPSEVKIGGDIEHATPLPPPRKKKIIGWREWARLPDLGVERIKAKIDTGARTSALHAFRITPFSKYGAAYVRFVLHPIQRKKTPEVSCVALVIDHRRVTDTGGRCEERYVIRTTLKIGKSRWPVELTLTNRDQMGFRMLIGRQAVRRRYVVDPSRSFVAGRLKRKRRAKKAA
ncbi:MAG: ATP-dependent zinc protease [Rhodospirillaceae bacterium]|nr:ATP-dependent zinc protease [Rhodospirillaceae bacterium]